MPVWLQEHYPFINPKHKVWVTYTNILVDRIVRLRLAELDSSDTIIPVQGDKERLVQELGNLTLSGRGVRPALAPFVPTCVWTTASRVWIWMIEDGTTDRALTKGEQDARGGLVKLGAVIVDHGRKFSAAWPEDAFEQRVGQLLSEDPYRTFWRLLKAGVPYDDAVETALGLTSLTSGTRVWMGKKLANWGRAFGYLPHGKLPRKRPSAQVEMEGV